MFLLCAGLWQFSHAADHPEHVEQLARPEALAKTALKKSAASAPAEVASSASAEPIDLGNDIKKALREKMIDRKKLTLVISDKPEPTPAKREPASRPASPGKTPTVSAVLRAPEPEEHAAPAAAPMKPPAVVAHSLPAPPAVVRPKASRDYIRAKAAALAGHEAVSAPHIEEVHAEQHWSYAGKTGPQGWSQLKPEFSTCAVGKRQSPINIEDSATLQGPAEPLQFNYQPSNGVVVNNGHTIQVNLQGNNSVTVRGTTYTLVQMHFHTPSEEQINYRSFAMVAHLVHKSAEGQLAVVAVLLDPGVANALIDKIWTYMPLDIDDQVRMPAGLLDLNQLLPKDQRYYQFIGSLTTPPCTEGVLWLVLKNPTQISQAQLRLFQQLYPNNARPVQPVNSRPIRNAL
jgi:carbonic anhydrase